MTKSARDQDRIKSPAQARAFDLMRAAAFEFVDSRFHWADEGQAATLLHGRLDDIPRSLRELTARIDTDEARAARSQAIRKLTWNGALYRVRYQARSVSGSLIWLEERGQRIAGAGKKPTHIQGVIRDIASDMADQDSAAYRASYDPLTGLWNEARMTEALSWQIASCTRYESNAALIVLQVSNIEGINQTYGFEAGDRLLKGIASRLSSHIRVPDHAARLTGAGFDGVVFGLCVDVKDEDMTALAERLLEMLTAAPYQSPVGDLYAVFAIGAVSIPHQAKTAIDTIDRARIALDHSLEREGVFVAYDESLPDLKARRRKAPIEADDILGALNSRNITLAYQPIVHASTRKPHHFECLLRLLRPDGQVVPAGGFIMAAERLGLVHLLDRRALELASETLAEQPDIILAVNVSAATITDEVAAKGYVNALKALGPMASRLIVELTETAALDDPATASGFSTDVRALGASFAIDDFGAGFTTFQNLMAIEAGEIKIDGSFIRDLSVTPHKQVFVRMMVDLAQTFSVKTVAEFVTTPEDADLLTRLGVDYLQGYLFGVPSPAPDWPGKSESHKSNVASNIKSGSNG